MRMRLSTRNTTIAMILFLMVVIGLPVLSFAETDVTDKVELVQSRMMFDRSANQNFLDVSLKNISEDVLLTPIKVVIDTISTADVTVANADGVTEDGKPYFEYSLEPSVLSPGQTISAKTWRFANPMRYRFSYTLSVLQIDAEGNLGSFQTALPENIVTDPETGTTYVIGQLIISPEDGVTHEQLDQLVSDLGGAIVGHINFVEMYQAQFSDLPLAELNELVDQMRQSPLIRAAVVNTVDSTNAEPNASLIPYDPWNNDPDVVANPESWGDSWDIFPWEDGLLKNRVPKGNNAAVESMRFPEAWNMAYYWYPDVKNVTPVKVGIVDSDFPVKVDELGNIETLHKDLQFEWANKSGSKYPDPDPDKKYQHGHHVAGIIGATANNGLGITGAAWFPRLYGYRMSKITSDKIYGICYLIIVKEVGLINLSVGENYGGDGPEDDRETIEFWSNNKLNNKLKSLTDFFPIFLENFKRLSLIIF